MYHKTIHAVKSSSGAAYRAPVGSLRNPLGRYYADRDNYDEGAAGGGTARCGRFLHPGRVPAAHGGDGAASGAGVPGRGDRGAAAERVRPGVRGCRVTTERYTPMLRRLQGAVVSVEVADSMALEDERREDVGRMKRESAAKDHQPPRVERPPRKR